MVVSLYLNDLRKVNLVFSVLKLTQPSYCSQTAKDRFTSEEKRALDRANNYLYQEVRQASEAHRQVGFDICRLLETTGILD